MCETHSVVNSNDAFHTVTISSLGVYEVGWMDGKLNRMSLCDDIPVQTVHEASCL